jgi:hypothetical protein
MIKYTASAFFSRLEEGFGLLFTFVSLKSYLNIESKKLITVSDGKGLGQPACQRGWKKYKEEDE